MQCVIIDAYSTGRYLPEALRRHGVSCTHVQSSPGMPDMKAARTITPNGTAMVESATISPQTELIQPSRT